jgi:type I restriction enzyme M protein
LLQEHGRRTSLLTDLQDFSRRLFAAANQLLTHSALRPDQYAQPVLALIALRQMEAKFEAVHAELGITLDEQQR